MLPGTRGWERLSGGRRWGSRVQMPAADFRLPADGAQGAPTRRSELSPFLGPDGYRAASPAALSRACPASCAASAAFAAAAAAASFVASLAASPVAFAASAVPAAASFAVPAASFAMFAAPAAASRAAPAVAPAASFAAVPAAAAASFAAPAAAEAASPVVRAAPAAASLAASAAASIFLPAVSAGPFPSSRLQPAPIHMTTPAKIAATATLFAVPIIVLPPFPGLIAPVRILWLAPAGLGGVLLRAVSPAREEFKWTPSVIPRLPLRELPSPVASRREEHDDRSLHLDDAQRPEGFSDARGDRSALHGAPREPRGRAAVLGRVHRHHPEPEDPRHRGPRRGRGAAGGLRVGGHPDLSGREERSVPVLGDPDARSVVPVVDVPDEPRGSDHWASRPLHESGPREGPVRDPAIRRRDAAHPGRPRRRAREPRVSGG